MRLWMPVAVVAMAGGSAGATELPAFDMTAWCEHVRTTAGGAIRDRHTCLREEQAALDELEATWAEVPEAARAWCAEVTSQTGATYHLLWSCVQERRTGHESPTR